jgi:hypothetical protein
MCRILIYLHYYNIYITLDVLYAILIQEFCRAVYYTTHESANDLINTSGISNYHKWRHRKNLLIFTKL